MHSMKQISSILIVTLTLIGCQRFIHSNLTSKRKKKANLEIVESCRELWNYSTTDDTIKIKVLKFESKGRYSNVSWPSFTIGTNSVGDTIGVIDYEFSGELKKGRYAAFAPSQRKEGVVSAIDSELDEPVFKVNRKRKDNELYCSVSAIYYGIVTE